MFWCLKLQICFVLYLVVFREGSNSAKVFSTLDSFLLDYPKMCFINQLTNAMVNHSNNGFIYEAEMMLAIFN